MQDACLSNVFLIEQVFCQMLCQGRVDVSECCLLGNVGGGWGGHVLTSRRDLKHMYIHEQSTNHIFLKK